MSILNIYVIMRNLLFSFFALFIFSCSLSDDTNENYFEILPIESVIIPEEFELNEVYEITLNYLRPTDCYAFNDIYYLRENNERTVAIIAEVFSNNGFCEEINTELERTFNFQATSTGSYIFKFWQGEDVDGEDQYLIVEVQVIE